MNTNINEKINNEMDMDQLECVNGGIVWEDIAVCAVASVVLSGAAAYAGWKAGKKCN